MYSTNDIYEAKSTSLLCVVQMLYHRGWYHICEAAKSGLHASLLVRHPETEELYVNFDPQIIEIIQEAKWLQVGCHCVMSIVIATDYSARLRLYRALGSGIVGPRAKSTAKSAVISGWA